MELRLIYARAANGTVGNNGQMPWHLPEDLAHFKHQTQGHPVIMGRKTWDSIPARFRPLPGRTNIVVTRQTDWANTPQAVGAQAVHHLDDALALARASGAEVAWAIGGADIWRLALPLAQQVVVTEIHADFDGDTFAPTLGPEWYETARERHTAANGLGYSFVTLRRG